MMILPAYFSNVLQTVSSNDFTQDSLYNSRSANAKSGSVMVNDQRTFEIHPFAYVSSSSSNSTEILTKEAETLDKSDK